jgi:hypothetical protein
MRFFIGLSAGGTIVVINTFVVEVILPQQRMVLRGIFNWVSDIELVLLDTVSDDIASPLGRRTADANYNMLHVPQLETR